MDDIYRTTDIGLASHLIAKGYKMTGTEPDGRRSWFLFEPEVRQEVEKYWSDDALVNPRIIINTLRELKARLFDGEKR